MKGVVAFDLGASSGRAIYTTLINDRLEFKELNRFSDYTIKHNGSIRWNMKQIYQEIEESLVRANALGNIESVAVNTWGVDFGLLDKKGKLIENPFHYRDLRTKGYMNKVKELISPIDLYNRTGIQNMEINTLYQLLALKDDRRDIYEQAHQLLLMPDLINYHLTGEIYSERSIASTTQLYNPKLSNWDYELIEMLGIKPEIFPEIIDSGRIIGTLKESIAKELNINRFPIITVASHDTASAVSSIPTDDSKLYLSSGTWSLFGTVLDEPVINKESYTYNMSNETGLNNKITFLKNITGLWLLQETKRQFEIDGKDYSYAELAQLASKTDSIGCYFDTELTELTVAGNIPKRIQMFAKKTKQNIPETDGQIVRTIYENLSLKYRATHDELVETVGHSFDSIYIVGGGSNADFLSQCTANALNLEVFTGYGEATVLGNALVQLETINAIASENEKNIVIDNTIKLKRFYPTDRELWDKMYDQYTSVIQNN